MYLDAGARDTPRGIGELVGGRDSRCRGVSRGGGAFWICGYLWGAPARNTQSGVRVDGSQWARRMGPERDNARGLAGAGKISCARGRNLGWDSGRRGAEAAVTAPVSAGVPTR